MKITGNALRIQRIELGLSQAKLAEVAGIPQHFLSSFELGKSSLPSDMLKAINDVFEDKERLSLVLNRVKRYRAHTYSDVRKLPDRVANAVKTPENNKYKTLLNFINAEHLNVAKKQHTALSLFSGCGGFSLGFSAAGFKVKGFVELEKDLREIYKLNFPDSIEMGGDITNVNQESLTEFSNIIGDIDVIIGGPPCQGFSLSGKRDVDDPRNKLFNHYLRFVSTFRPKIAVLENVRLISSMKNKEGGWVRDDICNEFIRHGYKIKRFEVNAKDYGVPQHRERVLFIAVRNDIDLNPSIPQLTHTEIKDLISSFQPHRTFADACSDLPYIESGEKSEVDLHEAVSHPSHVIDWLWDVKQGFSAHDNKDPYKRPPSGYNTTYKRQVWNEPAATVQTTFGMISGCRNVHPIATRSLTIREATRIQSFPDQYKFKGSLGSIRTGIGNAVPPLLAYTIALHLKKLL